MNLDQHDDAKLTAYALGELNDADRAAMEARLATDEGARRDVEEIRALAATLKAQLESETAAAAMGAPAETIKLHRRPRWAGRLAVAAAACVVVGGVTFAFITARRD